MTRRRDSDQGFGSDSFLDIIANIVGILIILIVIVGMKVARQGPDLLPDPSAPNGTVAVDPVDSASEPAAAADRDSERERADLAGRLVSLQKEQSDRLTEADRLNQELDQLAADAERIDEEIRSAARTRSERRNQAVLRQLELASADAELKQLARHSETLSESLTDVQNRLLHVDLAMAQLRQSAEALRDDRQAAIVETQRLTEQLQALDEREPEGDRLEHRLSPVSRIVSDDEEHFRLSGGRIARIPVAELLARLKSQVKSRSAIVRRFTRYEGTVGPIEGFLMSYVVERDDLSALQSVQLGVGSVRIVVTRWTITTADGLVAEPINDAVRPGSRFRRVVETLPPGSTVTLWTYPDSFEGFRAVREVAHGLQLRVAGRPLPEGTPIVGSPSGSRSRAQ